MRNSRRISALMLFLLLVCAAPAEADWRKDYREGIQAVDRQNWSEVATMMARASSENPSATKRGVKIYGTRYEVYIPYFFLGLARYHQGNCEGALAAWEISLSYGVVQGSSWSSKLDKLRAECLADQPAPVPATPTARPLPTLPSTPPGPDPVRLREAIERAESELQAAEQIQEEVLSLRSDSNLARLWQQDRALVTDHHEAVTLLDQARARLNRGRRASDLEVLGEAESLAARAREALAAIPGKVEAARQTELERLNEERRRQEELIRPTPVRRLAPTPIQVQPTAPPTTAPMISSPAPGRPAALVAGVTAYLEGDFRRAVELLENQSFPTNRAAAVADLVRAASIWLLYLEEGEEDLSLREGATTAVLSCKRLDDTVVPGEEAFAPSFVEFFHSSR
jgi:tetratricopeptide (TPR) repeat protein